MTYFVRMGLLLWMMWLVGCHAGGSLGSSAAGSGGAGGGGSGPCDVDCSAIKTAPCTIAVCNTGQVMGPMNTCIVVPSPDGSSCDDGQFCTVSDFCDKGACVGGPQNDCSLGHDPCSFVICYEDSKSCSVTPAEEGAPCTPTDLCQVDGVCQVGECNGVLKDCSSSPLAECNVVACDPGTGDCTGAPDPTTDGSPCVQSGDLCNVNKACLSGQCVGGTPKDCSLFDGTCRIGVCDSTAGICSPVQAPIGTPCTDGLQACQVGSCDMRGMCAPATASDGSACNDRDACTQGDTCSAGVCVGELIAGCKLYLAEGFESCPDGWTFAGDWQCGTPTSMSPVTPLSGQGVIATQLDGAYHNNQSFAACTADSPSIDLTQAENPQVAFWAWVSTNTEDGWNMAVSADGGATFTEVMTVAPPYPLTIASVPAWGGDLSAKGWQPYSADLSAYAGHSIILRFAFASDPTGVGTGVYIDDVLVAEPLQIPLFITTPSLVNAYVGTAYSAAITKVGGTSNSVWSINSGAVNAAWLSINPATGVLSGTPSAAQTGPVSVTVHVEEPMYPSNFADQTFTFSVAPDSYYTSFEGPCPDGWTLLGDWQCGVPMNPAGPQTAYVGTQCLGTGMINGYSINDTWSMTTATSPQIDLAGATSLTLTFRMWIDTEGGTFDGANVQISTDGGSTYSVLNTVTPVYVLTIAGEPAWGGHLATFGWQLMQADLTAYAQQKVRLRFAFQSDSSGTGPGVFIDDFLVE